jgi:hypothetical protein
MELPVEFAVLSRKHAVAPLCFPGPGGNTSIKPGGPMWIKARTQLAEADLFEGNARIHRHTLAKTES